MTVLVTGAAGFLGSHVIELLRERGERPRVLVRPGDALTERAGGDLDIRSADVGDRAALEAAVSGVDRIIHCAARTGPWGPAAEYENTNVRALKTLVEVAVAAGVRRLVHVSSITVHGTDVRGEADETAPLKAESDPYSRSKVAAERLLERMSQDDAAPVAIVRPGLIYGPRDTNSFARFARLIERGKMPIIGSGHNHVPLIYVTDVARALLLVSEADHAAGRAYLLVNDERVTQVDYFTAIAGQLGVKPPRVHIPYRLALALGAAAEAAGHLARMQQAPPIMRFGLQQIGGENRFLISRARSELGFCPQVSLADGVRQSIAWYRAQARC
jgi:nucleoside-diphosphate-sugar epimerase